MTRLFGVISIVLVLLAVAGSGSQDSTAPEVLWTKTFGTPNAPELAKKVRQTLDGGYILVGGAVRPRSGHYVYLIKTHPSGNLQWEKTLGDGKSDWGFDVQQTSDGGYIIAGADNGSGDDHDDRDFSRSSDVYLIKTDASGNVQWEKKFGGDRADKALRAQQTSDGGYIIIGVTASFRDGPWDVYLVKTDASGNLQWQKTFGTKGEDWGQAVQQTPDGGYILAGHIQVGEKEIIRPKKDSTPFQSHGLERGKQGEKGIRQRKDSIISPNPNPRFRAEAEKEIWQKKDSIPIFSVYVVRTDSSGNLIWEKSFGGKENNAKGYAIKIAPDGGYIVAATIGTRGKGDNDFYLLKVDTKGNMLWEKRFGVPVARENVWDLDVTVDGGYIPAGETIKGTRGKHDIDVFVVRTDADGNLVWKKVIGETGTLFNDWARGVQRTSDGGYILAGMTTSANGNKDAYLIKLAKDR